jgi:hypothetical protein
MDSSLREIGELLRAFLPLIRTKQRFQFWRVHAKENGNGWVKEELGNVLMHRRADKNEQRYIQNTKFNVGDFLDVSIYYK